MSMVLLRKLDNRFEADLWCHALDQQGIPYRFRTFEDSAYDGLFVTQRGYGDIHVDEKWLQAARRVDAELSQVAQTRGLLPGELATRLEHTLLEPTAGAADLQRHLDQCLQWGMAAACVSPWMVAASAERLAGGPVALCTVVGFPLGTQSAATKAAEAAELHRAGAAELDLVINRSLLLEGSWDQARAEVAAVRAAAPQAVLKVILEMSQLPQAVLERTVALCAAAGADYLKTGSGYFGPAEVEQVKVLRRLLDQGSAGLGIKAAGGIRSLEQALELVAAGADRLGTSAGAAIMDQASRDWGPEA